MEEEEVKEGEEEEVMAPMCHNSENCSAIKVNRGDDEYYKQLNQLNLAPSLVLLIICHIM